MKTAKEIFYDKLIELDLFKSWVEQDETGVIGTETPYGITILYYTGNEDCHYMIYYFPSFEELRTDDNFRSDMLSYAIYNWDNLHSIEALIYWFFNKGEANPLSMDDVLEIAEPNSSIDLTYEYKKKVSSNEKTQENNNEDLIGKVKECENTIEELAKALKEIKEKLS